MEDLEKLEVWAAGQPDDVVTEITLDAELVLESGPIRVVYLKVTHVPVELDVTQAKALGITGLPTKTPATGVAHKAVVRQLQVAALRYGVALGSKPGWGDLFYHISGELTPTHGAEHLPGLVKILGL